VKKSPLIKGSGIPQVKAFLQQQLKFDWKRELPYKFLGGVLALGAGLSLGREGPSIQLGALAGSAVDQKLGRGELRHFLATAGAAAGISAAFNAPLAGVLFCVEELHRNISSVLLTSTLIASFPANAVMWAAAGNAALFSLDIGQTLPLGHYFTCVLGIGIATGLLGSLFNAGLLGFQKAYARLVPQEGSRIISAFAVAALVSLVAAPHYRRGRRTGRIDSPGQQRLGHDSPSVGRKICFYSFFLRFRSSWRDISPNALPWSPGRGPYSWNSAGDSGCPALSHQFHILGHDRLFRSRRSGSNHRRGAYHRDGRFLRSFPCLHLRFNHRHGCSGAFGHEADLRQPPGPAPA